MRIWTHDEREWDQSDVCVILCIHNVVDLNPLLDPYNFKGCSKKTRSFLPLTIWVSRSEIKDIRMDNSSNSY